MSYRIQKIINGKTYAYEITSFRDPETKKVKKKSLYLGIIREDGSIEKRKESMVKELGILDFGDGYFLYEFLKKTNIFPLLSEMIKEHPEIFSLIIYRICYQSSMYNAATWYEGNIVSVLLKDIDLSSQNISRVLAYLGQEKTQRSFFEKYLSSVVDCQDNVIIDASSLPNQINHSFSTWGHSDSAIEKQFRFLCVINQKTQTPLFYRFLPGNIVDISSLKNTISELKLMGAKNKFVLLDAGYCSEENLSDLYKNNIDFLIRLPTKRTLYKECILSHLEGLEHIQYATKYDERVLFVKPIEKDLYGHKGFAYIVLDPTRKAKEIHSIVSTYLDDYKKQCYWFLMNSQIEFKKIKLPKNCISCYVKIKDNHEQLFYIEGKKKEVTLLSIKEENRKKFAQLSEKISDKTCLSEEIIEQLMILSNHKIKESTIEKECMDFYFKKSGIMILISSKKIETIDIISSYYIRQNIEQIFGFFKDDLGSLPIRRHNDNTVQGYLFLQFIILILFLQFRKKLEGKYTVEQAVLLARNLKCKIFEKTILVSEANKKQTEIYKLGDVVVPKNLGI
jgi:transposase